MRTGGQVRLPPGCYGFQTPAGEQINGRPGSVVTLEPHQLDAVKNSTAVKNGIVEVTWGQNLGTKRGRPCTSAPGCLFVAQVWSDTCPRCGAPTEEAQHGPLRTE